MNSIASPSARSSTPRSKSCRTISTIGSEVTMRKGRIKAAGVSARRRVRSEPTSTAAQRTRATGCGPAPPASRPPVLWKLDRSAAALARASPWIERGDGLCTSPIYKPEATSRGRTPASECSEEETTDATSPGRVFRDCPNCPEIVVLPARQRSLLSLREHLLEGSRRGSWYREWR
jgi:hypothetical protein